ncbi:hypothetical protein HAX54_023816 [Datura stramonium]|uniref:Uncharacterized protein n=1 Tax=Datura stramonium TaxID=4076 RepID=A0ABS8UZW9_DATST|nr:hypothetical protein [Datura stramonium]
MLGLFSSGASPIFVLLSCTYSLGIVTQCYLFTKTKKKIEVSFSATYLARQDVFLIISFFPIRTNVFSHLTETCHFFPLQTYHTPQFLISIQNLDTITVAVPFGTERIRSASLEKWSLSKSTHAY